MTCTWCSLLLCVAHSGLCSHLCVCDPAPPPSPPPQELHSTFIVEGASFSIQCPPEVRRVVQRSLWPAFEELFDAAEEHALSVLVGRWRKMVEEEESKVASKVSRLCLVE